MIRFLIGMVLVLFMIGEVGAASPIIDAGEVRPKAANTNLYIHPSGSGSLRLGSFSGVLKASTGVLSASAVDLTTEITGILPIANGGTGSSTQNFVDLTTTQSVAGLKTFSDQINVNDPLLMDHTTSTEPASGKCAFYPKSDGNFYKFCNGGSEAAIGGSSSIRENFFAARVTSAAAVTSENVDWISSISKGGTGIYNITFTTSFFSATPALIGTAASPNRIFTVTSASTSSATIQITTDGGSVADDGFAISAFRQAADYYQ
jgi:hypothetical protein